jgi:hypothetical protein
MPNVYAKHAASVASVMDYLGPACPTIAWSGNNIRCLPRDSANYKKLDPGGFRLEADISIVCLLADFNGILPKPNQMFTLNTDGTTYRVESTRVLTGGTLVRLTGYHQQQGA